MITIEELNEDQRKSFAQMTLEGGLSSQKALELIDEFCIQKGFTGLRASQFILTPEGREVAELILRTEEGKN